MQRVLVAGITGAGKTTAAQRIARQLDAPFHEMDALALGPGWSTPPTFVADVERILAEPRWVFDSYGYEQVRAAMWAAADTVVWLDYPVRVVMPRIVRRSVSRSWHRTPVFGGNVETWRSWLTADHPVWWALRQHAGRRRAIAELVRQAGPDLRLVRMTRPRQLEKWLDAGIG